ncbi:MAG: flagellar motor protein MotD [Gammaproteobacteria bacterium]|nr:flagellar motor protein MotD [Gammaproteobacteria bacterium]MBT8150936.1 flagellar motor protein MotD [Gammaproteobacteria bacterium]NND39458.1 flagellar motor protein MotD [Pseudomonadales bacterium]
MQNYRPNAARYTPERDTAEVQGHNRWLVSYADFMTLLMAFFVVMYSISQVSEQKYRVLSETFSQAFNAPVERENLLLDGEPQHSFTKTPIDMQGKALEDRPGNDANEVPATLTRIAEELEQRFESLIDNELVTVTGDERWLQIALPSAVLFDSGGAQLGEPAQAIIEEIAATLAPHDNVVRVEGFTDNLPIKTAAFQSNWELSAARAAAVVRRLQDSGIAPGRLAAVGYGAHQPAHSNNSAEGRSKNRRIVLMVSTQNQLRHDVIAPEEVITTPYEQRAELPEGTLVHGLERTALQEARAWLARRTRDAAATVADSAPEQLTSENAPLEPAEGVQRIRRSDGSLLFTGAAAGEDR